MMRYLSTATAVAGLVASGHATAITVTGPPMGIYKTAYNAAAVTATTLLDIPLATGHITIGNLVLRREAEAEATPAPRAPSRLHKRDDVCVPQPSGIPYKTNPDDPSAFQKDPYFSNASTNAVVPSGYEVPFQNILAANNADNYQGYTFMDSYDVASCAANCNAQNGCASFNIYFERDPALSPDPTSCPNPVSVTRIKCVWWGGLVSLDNANNYGQQEASFYVVIAGSSGYINSVRAAKIRAAAASASASASASGSASATQQAAAATETAKGGSVWLVYYSADSNQGSYNNTQAADSEADCQIDCDADPSCAAYTYVGGASGVGSGTCWLKTSLGQPTSAGNNYVSGTRVAAGNSGAAAGSAAGSATSSVVQTNAAAAASTSAPGVANKIPVSTSSISSTSTVSIDRPVYGSSSAAAGPTYLSTASYSPQAAAVTSAAAVSTASSAIAVVSTTVKSVASNSTTVSVSPMVSTAAKSASAIASGLPYNPSSALTLVPPSTVSNIAPSVPVATPSGVSIIIPSASSIARPSASSIVMPSGFSILTPSALSIVTPSAASIAKSVVTPSTLPIVTPSVVTPVTLSTGVSAKLSTTLVASVAPASASASASAKSTTSFLMRVGPSADTAAWAYLDPNGVDGLRYITDQSKATTFTIDSAGNLRSLNSTTNGVALVPLKGGMTTGSWQRVMFLPQGMTMNGDVATCQVQAPYITCSTSAGPVFSGGCLNNGYIYLGLASKIPWGCGWTGLYPVYMS